MSYAWVKVVHMGCVTLSISLFALRGALALRGQPWRRSRFLRLAPHIVDTVLLSTALWMAWQIGQYPFVNGWLTAKVLALVAYILLGSRALAHNTAQAQRLPYFAGALFSVGYIVGVALTHSASWGF
jgi:uncharacterized membrane protein SirB2